MAFKVTILTASGVELNEENGYLLPYNEKTKKYYDYIATHEKRKQSKNWKTN